MSATAALRPDLASAAYGWQEGVPEGADVARFDMNTSPRPPAWYTEAAARVARVPVHHYPDAGYRRLREALSRYTGFTPERIVPAAGADEALQLCALAVLRPGDRASAERPCYGMYDHLTRLAGASLTDEPDGARLHWRCVPHNPTGADSSDADRAERDGVVVIDQAYLEFGGEDLSRLCERRNTVVVRTLSKAFGLAGARVGYLLCPPDLAGTLDAIRLPAGISAASAALAELALEHLDEMRDRVAETVAERDRMAATLAAAGYAVRPSVAGFLLVDTGRPAAEVAAGLLARRMVVRTFSDPTLATAIRISPGTPAENDRLLEALGAAVAPPRPAPGDRRGTLERRTRETEVAVRIDLDGTGRAAVATGIGFLDHMLTALACHALADLDLTCSGDLWVDAHHTVEDVAIALGGALHRALGDRAGLARFGDARAPLDEAICQAVVDLSGRGVCTADLQLHGPAIGALPVSLVGHLFDTLARNARIGIHLTGTGADDHHVVEAAFKALALALRAAWTVDPRRDGVPSTKGSL